MELPPFDEVLVEAVVDEAVLVGGSDESGLKGQEEGLAGKGGGGVGKRCPHTRLTVSSLLVRESRKEVEVSLLTHFLDASLQPQYGSRESKHLKQVSYLLHFPSVTDCTASLVVRSTRLSCVRLSL